MSDSKISALVAAALTLAMGCSAGVKATNPPSGAAGTSGNDAGVDRPNIVGTGGATGAGGAGGACTPTYTCDPAGGRYCNTIGNGCPGQKLECGACPGDATCSGGAIAPGICQRRELPGDHLSVGRQRPVLRQDW